MEILDGELVVVHFASDYGLEIGPFRQRIETEHFAQLAAFLGFIFLPGCRRGRTRVCVLNAGRFRREVFSQHGIAARGVDLWLGGLLAIRNRAGEERSGESDSDQQWDCYRESAKQHA
jgi:hypothetical protein